MQFSFLKYFFLQIFFIFYQLIFRGKSLLSKRSIRFHGSSKNRFIRFPRSLQDSLPHCTLFFLLNRSERHRFSVRFLSEYTHSPSLILQQNCMHRKSTGPRGLSPLYHRLCSFCISDDAPMSGICSRSCCCCCFCCCRAAAYETRYDSLKNAKCNALSSKHDIPKENNPLRCEIIQWHSVVKI